MPGNYGLQPINPGPYPYSQTAGTMPPIATGMVVLPPSSQQYPHLPQNQFQLHTGIPVVPPGMTAGPPNGAAVFGSQ